MLRAFGGDLFDARRQEVPAQHAGVDRRPAVIADLYNKHKVALPLGAGAKQTDAPELFQGQKCMAIVSTSSQPGRLLAGSVSADKFEMDVLPNPLGPTGKHATQVSSDGKGCRRRPRTRTRPGRSSRCTPARSTASSGSSPALGSPGSRNDVWDSDEFREGSPSWPDRQGHAGRPGKAPPMLPWHHPANGRFFEAEHGADQRVRQGHARQQDVDKYAAPRRRSRSRRSWTSRRSSG